MFRIFKSGYGVESILSYKLGDGVPGILFGIAAAVLMLWMAVTSAAYMYLPLLAILAGLTMLLYLGGKAGELRGIAAFYAAYPLLVYGWTGMCWTVFAATDSSGNGVIGMMGWLVLAVVGVFVLVIPSFEAANSSIGGLVIIPLAALWISAIIFGLADDTNSYYATACRIVTYTFHVFGIMMAVALICWLIMAVKTCIDHKDSIKNLLGSFLMFVLGCLPLMLVPLLSTILSSWMLAAGLLTYFLLLALATYRRGGHGPMPGAQYAILPVLLAWFARVVLPLTAVSDPSILPVGAVSRVLSFCSHDWIVSFADHVGGPLLASFGALLAPLFAWTEQLLRQHLGVDLAATGIPDLLVLVCGFFLILLVLWLGTLVRDKVGK